MDPEIQKQMGAMRMMRQQQQNCMAKVQAMKQTQKRIELTQKEISTVSSPYRKLFKINNQLELRHTFPKFKLTSAHVVNLGTTSQFRWCRS